MNITHMNHEYVNAAKFLKAYVLENNLELNVRSDQIEQMREEFKSQYGPSELAALDDDSLLSFMFYTTGDNTNALCCWLEMNKECKDYFGSISGGSAYKFGLFQKKENGVWMTGSPQKPQELSESEALYLGKSIRDALVKGAHIIENTVLDSLEAYETLHDHLVAEIGEQYCNWSWIHKYFSVLFCDRLSSFHSTDWQIHVLRALKIRPSDKYYARSGQIAMVQKHLNWYYGQFFEAFYERFGGPRQFVRIGTSDGVKNYAAQWAKRGVIAMGWAKLGNLTEYTKGDSIDRKAIQNQLKEQYYQSDERLASRKAGEIVLYYKCESNTVFVVMDGERLIALADNVGAYYFNGDHGDEKMPHQRTASWKFVFESDAKMPEKSEGKLTSCYQLKNKENLLFLYERYYYGEDFGNHLVIAEEEIQKEDVPKEKAVCFHTGYQSSFERNRIIFGAPGTGKSFTLNREAKELLGEENENDYERVTFHPDYSYANFVGTYKPVPCKDSNGNEIITYAYVPGPFMRVYVKALKNSRNENIKPFLLIIEEMNRANAAAVFGDIFQLLDRNEENISEYPIQASEDMKKYLCEELGGTPDDYSKLRIPDHMFLWATMNSADQGVFPMDTAFKRRWDFTYLGIDDNDEKIRGKYVYLAENQSQKVEWNKLRKAINHFLAKEKINEDKQLGPYFISKNIVVPDEGDEIDRDRFIRTFKNKVIMYLFEDAARQKRSKLFEGCFQNSSRFSEICREFEAKGIGIFHHDIQVETEPEEVQTQSGKTE